MPERTKLEAVERLAYEVRDSLLDVEHAAAERDASLGYLRSCFEDSARLFEQLRELVASL